MSTPSSSPSTHDLLGRARSRFSALRPLRGLARRTFFRGLFFGAFVLAVSLVGRAWAKVRLPSPAIALAVPVDDAPVTPAAVASPTPIDAAASASERPAVSLTASTSPAPVTEATSDRSIDLNKASAAELETLPYVGPKRAEAILALRTKLGRFRSVDELLKVKGIGRGTLKRMRSRLIVGA